MSKLTHAAALVGAVMLLGAGQTARADTVTPFGDTVGTGPWNLTSVCAPSCPPAAPTYSGLDVLFSTPFALNTLTTLSATFVDNAGGAGGGSPRIGLYATNGDFFLVYLGPPPSFDDPNPATFTAAYSGTNLINGTNNTAVGNSGSYQTFASLLPTYGTDMIEELAFFLDGGWVRAQDLTLTGITVNGTTYSSSLAAEGEVPLPAALPLFASGLGALGFAGWRRKRKQLKAAA